MQFDNQKTRNVADVVAKILAGESAKQEPQMLGEELVGNQHKIDANKNKKIDAHDFKLLRAQKEKEKANSQKFGKDVKEEVKEVEEAADVSKSKVEKFHMNLDNLVHKTFGHSPAEKKEKMKKEETEIDEAMFPGTKEYEKKYGQSPQQKLKKVGDTEKTAQGEMKKTAKGVIHTRRFSEMVSAYQEQGLKFVASLVKEEPDNEEFTKEVEEQKKRDKGEIRNDKGVAKPFQAASVREDPVNPVREDTEIHVINADIANGVQFDNIEEDIELDEREMTDAEMKKREDIVKGMKKGMAGFKQRYGDRAKSVMYATATKQAMKEEKEDHYQKGYDHVRDPIADEPYLDNARERFNELKKQNPHKKGTQEHKDWHSGASAAYEEHKDMLRGN